MGSLKKYLMEIISIKKSIESRDMRRRGYIGESRRRD